MGNFIGYRVDPIMYKKYHEKSEFNKNFGKSTEKITIQFNDDTISSVPLTSEKFNEIFDKIKNTNEVIIRSNNVRLILTYPLTKQYTEIIDVPKDGLTLGPLLRIIVTAYENIFKIKETSENGNNDEDLQNKKEKEDYGVWGHSLEDLSLISIIFNSNSNEISVEVDS